MGSCCSKNNSAICSIVSLGQSCFTGDTLVATKEGQKPIEEIEVGDEVWSYNIETGEAKLNKVAKVFIHETETE